MTMTSSLSAQNQTSPLGIFLISRTVTNPQRSNEFNPKTKMDKLFLVKFRWTCLCTQRSDRIITFERHLSNYDENPCQAMLTNRGRPQICRTKQ